MILRHVRAQSRTACAAARAIVWAGVLAGCAGAYQGAPPLAPVDARTDTGGRVGAVTPAASRAPVPRRLGVPAAEGASDTPPSTSPSDAAARVGPNDLLEITVLEAPEMSRSVRVAATGRISLPLLGELEAAGRTPRELELALEAALRRRYIRDPHVGVQVTEMQGHGIAVVGAVLRPGVFQVRESRSLLDVIALAGGFAREAGDAVVVVRGGSAGQGAAAAPGAPLEVRIADLLGTGDPRHNVPVHPGDLVKVTSAGVVYVVGHVRKPGAFPLELGARVTVLQAIALGEGFAEGAARSRARIIRTGARGERQEIPVDLGAVIGGRAPDLPLEPRDVLFVPNSRTRGLAIGAVDALVRMVTLRAVF